MEALIKMAERLGLDNNIMKISEHLQKEAHEVAEVMMKTNKRLSYQDCLNVYLFIKLSELLNRITEPQKEVSQEKPDSSTDDGQQNPSQLKEATEIDFTIKGNTELCSSDGLLIQENKTSNSEATILSAEEVLIKTTKSKDIGHVSVKLRGGYITQTQIVAAMEEYKNQEVQLLNK